MHIKDHYKILELHPSASLPEIKKAYRRLAQVYHPDKNNGDPYALEHFNAVKEAYEVLTDPSRKERYLQQRWYNQSIGKKKTRDILTPVSILKEALELDRYVSTLDVHRMDKEGLKGYIDDILSSEIIEKLNAFNDLDINREITHSILRSSLPLPLKLAEPVYSQLNKIKNDAATSSMIREQLRLRQKDGKNTELGLSF
jgi:curved DNA-binding protein CbpA